MSKKYDLFVEHCGTETCDFCIFLTNDSFPENFYPLVVFSKRAHRDTKLHFSWSTEYGFTWSDQGCLQPGVVFQPMQIVPADPWNVNENSISLVKDWGDTYRFQQTDAMTRSGHLEILCPENIPVKSVSIGITMSGNAAYACAAEPNKKFTFRSEHRCWIDFGKFEKGQVLSMDRMNHKMEICFRENQYEKTIRLNEGNQWIDLSK